MLQQNQQTKAFQPYKATFQKGKPKQPTGNTESRLGTKKVKWKQKSETRNKIHELAADRRAVSTGKRYPENKASRWKGRANRQKTDKQTGCYSKQATGKPTDKVVFKRSNEGSQLARKQANRGGGENIWYRQATGERKHENKERTRRQAEKANNKQRKHKANRQQIKDK